MDYNIVSIHDVFVFQLVKNSMPPNFYERYNNDGKTAKQVFINTHRKLVKEGSKWLTKPQNDAQR
jgi:hypothetical protein